MRETLTDIVKQTIGIFETIKVTGTDTETKLQAVDKDKTLFLEAILDTPIEDFKGEFGLTNLSLLRGLLDFTSYRSDNASFVVKKKEHDGKMTVEQFEFADASGSGKSIFRCMSGDRVPEQAEIRNIPWDLTFIPSRSRLAEFDQLSKLYAVVDNLFGAKTEGSNLIFSFGEDNSSMHRGSMVFQDNIDGTMKGEPLWNMAQFMSIMKIASDNHELKISSRGILGVEAKTNYGLYKYYLRASTR